MGKKKVAQIADVPEKKAHVVSKEAPARDAEQKPTESAPIVTSKRGKRVEKGRVYVKASYNNTVVTVTDEKGNVITWATAGSLGFSGPKKATPFAASKIVAVIAEKMKNLGMSDIEIFVRGIGSGRDATARSLANQGFNITAIRDVTGIPHNGPRPKKVRRV